MIYLLQVYTLCHLVMHTHANLVAFCQTHACMYSQQYFIMRTHALSSILLCNLTITLNHLSHLPSVILRHFAEAV